MKRIARLVLVLTVAAVTVLGPVAQADVKGDTLHSGESLKRGDGLISQNQQFALYLLEDGNLVLYTGYNSGSWTKALWASGTYQLAVSEAKMQTDGNFVIYGFPKALWASNTDGNAGSYLVLQNDGNLVIYRPSAPVWATNTQQQ